MYNCVFFLFNLLLVCSIHQDKPTAGIHKNLHIKMPTMMMCCFKDWKMGSFVTHKKNIFLKPTYYLMQIQKGYENLSFQITLGTAPQVITPSKVSLMSPQAALKSTLRGLRDIWRKIKNFALMLPNESTALMRVLVDKKSKNATPKSTDLQNVPNESTGWQKMQSLPVWICSRTILNSRTFSCKTYGTPYVGRCVLMEWNTLCRWVYHLRNTLGR